MQKEFCGYLGFNGYVLIGTVRETGHQSSNSNTLLWCGSRESYRGCGRAPNPVFARLEKASQKFYPNWDKAEEWPAKPPATGKTQNQRVTGGKENHLWKLALLIENGKSIEQEGEIVKDTAREVLKGSPKGQVHKARV